MKTIYCFLKPNKHQDYLLFVDAIHEMVDFFDKSGVCIISLVSTEYPIYLSPMFDGRNGNKHLEPGNYIFASSSSYSKLLQAQKLLRSQLFDFIIFDLNKYECDPLIFKSSFSSNECDSMLLDEFIAFVDNKEAGHLADCENRLQHILSFYDNHKSRIEVFREGSFIYYFTQRNGRVFEFLLEEDIIKNVCSNDTYLQDFYRKHITKDSNYATILIANDELQIYTYSPVFWKNVVEKLISVSSPETSL